MSHKTSPIDQILETDFWPETIRPGFVGSRVGDDNDGDASHQLMVTVGDSGLDAGDVYLMTPQAGSTLRFRTELGGGASPRVRNALLLLAEAIRRDNEARPQRQTRASDPQDNLDLETQVCLEVVRKLASGKHLDSDLQKTLSEEQQQMIKQAFVTTAMEVYEQTWNEFQRADTASGID